MDINLANKRKKNHVLWCFPNNDPRPAILSFWFISFPISPPLYTTPVGYLSLDPTWLHQGILDEPPNIAPPQ